ncbi:PqqD family protein [Paenibacillus sp. A3M_27_13]|uniref:PqqD family protein n=1 Tax=Paenibacillus sp. A3M_27_13 TaxID=2962029 RepID=UPI00265E85E8|nr:PqqD family protein [Paenibacillus sp. A3M_27_13]
MVFDTNSGSTFEMDMVAYDIYSFFKDKPQSIEELYTFLLQEYAVTKDEITEDVEILLNRFLEAKILEVCKGGDKHESMEQTNCQRA